MGSALNKPVMSTVVERKANRRFVCAVSELNGYRNSMEDAHVIHLTDEWAAFGVFDGHGGDACSKWIANRFTTEFESRGCPADDAAVKKLFLEIDREFLDTKKPSGTTATMCIVRKPTTGGKHKLHVINAGDSRVLLGRRDGTIVDGGGTDFGLTTDHKPENPNERARIQANGGFVEAMAGGVWRLNGELSVSRGFGDAEYKKQGADPTDLENQPSTASPEMGHFECDESDFLLLVCDGVSEGDFNNSEVVRHAAHQLKAFGDPGAAATAVCHKAVTKNSKDNVTCMMVLLEGSEDTATTKILNPGPLSCPSDQNFMKAYEAMAGRAGLTLAQAVELRYDQIIDQHIPKGTEDEDSEANHEKDKVAIGEPDGEKGSAKRTKWFETRIQALQAEGGGGDDNGLPNGLPDQLAALLRAQGISTANFRNKNNMRKGVKVRVPELDTYKRAVEKNAALKWEVTMEDLALKTGIIMEDDESDGTTKVKFEEVGENGGIVAWMPTEILVEEQ